MKIYKRCIQHLVQPDDLDMIVGTAKLDTVYLAVTDRLIYLIIIK